RTVVPPGTRLGEGLTVAAAGELGLKPGTAVGAGLIGAHAGGLGTVGSEGAPTDNLAYVFGTSSCTMTTTTEPVFVPGVWGPYYSAMIPGMWLNEGGQSAAGAAIAQLLSFHPAAAEATLQARAAGQALPDFLATRALDLAKDASSAIELAKGLHVVPEFLGNRAPFADPHARAIISGLGMDNDVSSLVALYIAGICGVGYGLRQIMDAQTAAGATVNRVMISGGAGHAPLVRQLLADAAGLPVVTSAAEEPVLMGAAMLGAIASGTFKDAATTMAAMSRAAATLRPAQATTSLHAHRYAAFKALQDVARAHKC
ncbi:ribulokinase, partial [Thioclava sp. BHET1]